ncbi:NADH:flavin oxidoreductase [Chondromyces apiculatus]|uniref:2,4-dienoyl-CoA reductase n=1 Tax=Chondromyces apiculatus DSM 436 TaxID=1192034 RepID=A0A017SWS5_9BACT|nr:NADH:flavin oxidoreductase [Chondromyces apiculatus]EYF00781.1 2,4-dienoyl-CoA reductase [Chondromyces apiculatus DSM 436]
MNQPQEPTAPPHTTPRSPEALFRPFSTGKLHLANRIVMAPMTRAFSPDGVPGPDVAAYYRRRAEGGVGLIITEGTWVPHPSAGNNPRVPRFHGEDALAGWRRVVDEVHGAGGRIMPQLWHTGFILEPPGSALNAVSPSGIGRPGETIGAPMTQEDIDAVIAAFGKAAASARELGFDGVELHGAHGYLFDQFFWEVTNQRTDRYGGDLVARTRFAVETLKEVRRQVGPDFPIVLRYSQWKQQDYGARLAHTPADLERFLAPLVDAGVDIFHCSQRRFWEPEFTGSDLNLAGWTRKLTGKPTVSVGSVTLDTDLQGSLSAGGANTTGLDALLDRLEREEFDLVAVGRSLIANPSWPAIVRSRHLGELQPFRRELLGQLH